MCHIDAVDEPMRFNPLGNQERSLPAEVLAADAWRYDRTDQILIMQERSKGKGKSSPGKGYSAGSDSGTLSQSIQNIPIDLDSE